MKVLYATISQAPNARTVPGDLLRLESELEIRTVEGAAGALVEIPAGGYGALFVSPSVPHNDTLALISNLRRDRTPIAIVAIVTDADRLFFRHAITAVDEAAERMGRTMPVQGLPQLLADSRESPHWDDVASRCLTCGNCTMVCPTCFCTTTEDVTDLTGDHAERWRLWDSCFALDFSYLHGGSVRTSGQSRYRQWITHKLGTWHDQFGSSGCVGCGRCIAWCPTGIDITQEVSALARLQDAATADEDEDRP